MLKRMFVAPDPGGARLRFAARAVLGIGLAVVVCFLAGLSLPGVVTGGLAALLALFTVADATVRGQAATTALLPAVGVPVLAAAAGLHAVPVARDLAFMTFFVARVLHATPAQLPGLYTAVLLSVFSAAAVRFGVWCYERRLPPAVVPAPPAPRGLARVTWWIFVNTASRGETSVRGFRRVLGTVIGICLGFLVAVPVHGAPLPTAVLAAAVFGIFYTAAVSYTWMMLFEVSTRRVARIAGLGRVFADQAQFSWRRLMCGCGHLRQSVGGRVLTFC